MSGFSASVCMFVGLSVCSCLAWCNGFVPKWTAKKRDEGGPHSYLGRQALDMGMLYYVCRKRNSRRPLFPIRLSDPLPCFYWRLLFSRCARSVVQYSVYKASRSTSLFFRCYCCLIHQVRVDSYIRSITSLLSLWRHESSHHFFACGLPPRHRQRGTRPWPHNARWRRSRQSYVHRHGGSWRHVW